jgi:hypothetical protein
MRGDAGPAQPGGLRPRPSQIINRRSREDAEAPCQMRPVIELICWFGIAASCSGVPRFGQDAGHPLGTASAQRVGVTPPSHDPPRGGVGSGSHLATPGHCE